MYIFGDLVALHSGHSTYIKLRSEYAANIYIIGEWIHKNISHSLREVLNVMVNYRLWVDKMTLMLLIINNKVVILNGGKRMG